MKHTDYYKSGQHVKNIKLAREKAVEKTKLNKKQRLETYNLTPKLCENCYTPIVYEKRTNKFCSKSCSAIVNNYKRGPRSDVTKLKISKANTGKLTGNTRKFTPIHYHKCKICGKEKYVNWKKKDQSTCGSDDCKVQASVGIRPYQNGSRKPVWFYNPFENKEVLLESSWEVKIAELLITKNIKWIRPSFIKWQDSAGKIRRYFPDFYLPEYNVYLDPKNPYCLKLDNEKIKIVSQQVTLIAGGLAIIEKYVDKISNLKTI
jgi:hypothetical protein